MKRHWRERTLYKNKKGKIVRYEDTMLGGFQYKLFDSAGNFVKEIPSYLNLRIADYL